MLQRGGIAPETFRRETGANRYRMIESLVSMAEDFAIENGHGRIVFVVDSQALHLRDLILFRDAQGRELYSLSKTVASAASHPVYRELAVAATIERHGAGSDHELWSVSAPGMGPIDLKGRVADHEYLLVRNSLKVAEVSKGWFHSEGCYGVEIVPGQDNALILAIVAGVGILAETGSSLSSR
jgi:uncharacterized protein YxjI